MKCEKLKVQKIGDLCFDFKMGKNIEPNYYRKSEVDAAIDELKKEIKRTQNKLCVEKENVWQLEEQLRKQKYKRCLKLSEYCFLKSYIAYCERDAKSWARWLNWKDRWLRIAYKFKG